MKTAVVLLFALIGSLVVYSSAQCNRRNVNTRPRVQYVPVPYDPNSKNPTAAITAALLSARALNGEQGLDGFRTLQAIQALQAQNQAQVRAQTQVPNQIPSQVQTSTVGK